MAADNRGKRPADQVKEGLGLLWSAARQAAGGIREELDRTQVGKSIDDAGRELGRAVTNVATRLGAELKKVQPSREPDWVHRAQADGDDGEPWPTSREDYERRYGKVPDGQDWPRSRDEYEKHHGHAPGHKPKGPTPHDPGFRIADDDDDKKPV
jgi:hypothetical protein